MMQTAALTTTTKSAAAPTMPTTRYIGRITSLHGDYGFIGIRSVTKFDGSAHDLVDKDVYVHKIDLKESGLAIGLEVSFKVAPNPRREGTFRAVEAEPIEALLVPPDEPVIPGFALVASKYGDLAAHPICSPYIGMKEVPTDLVQLATANSPFKDVPRDEQEVGIGDDPVALEQALENYLRIQSPSLQALGIDYRVTGYDDAAITEIVKAAVAGYNDMGMRAQAMLLGEEYARFRTTRQFLAWILQNGWLRPGTRLAPSMLAVLIKLVAGIQRHVEKEAVAINIRATVDFMADHGLLRPNTILPMECLPELFCACPVWYFAFNDTVAREAEGQYDARGMTYSVACMLRSFANLFGLRWSRAFQLFNPILRPLARYQGDQFPPHVLRLVREARQVFDRVVIMTPYHDVVLGDWKTRETWARAMDPYVVGFKDGLPVFFVLARFSNGGIFPLLHELTADAMDFLQKHMHRALPPEGASTVETTRLIQGLIDAFRGGTLYDWLREKPATAK